MDREDPLKKPLPEWAQYLIPAVALALFWKQSQKKESSKLFSPEWIRTIALIGGVALSVIGGYFATQERINDNQKNIEQTTAQLNDLKQQAGQWQGEFIVNFNKYQDKQSNAFDRLNMTLAELKESQVRLTTMVEERFKKQPPEGGGNK